MENVLYQTDSILFQMSKKLPNWHTNNIEELKPFSKVNYILADLDGTLLSSNSQQISDIFKDLFKKLHYYKYPVKFSIATGRTFTGIKAVLDQISLDSNSPIILYNGSLIINKTGEVIHCDNHISKKMLFNITKLVDLYSIDVYAYFFNVNCMPGIFENNYPEAVYGWSNGEKIKYDFNKMIINWKNNIDLSEDYKLLAILLDISSCPENVNSIIEYLNKISEITITSSGNKYIEIRPTGNDKGEALKRIKDLLKIKKEEILSIGDNNNDIEMFNESGVSVSVSNASPLARNNSQYICDYNVVGGVIQLLRLIRNSKRLFYKNIMVNSE